MVVTDEFLSTFIEELRVLGRCSGKGNMFSASSYQAHKEARELNYMIETCHYTSKGKALTYP